MTGRTPVGSSALLSEPGPLGCRTPLAGRLNRGGRLRSALLAVPGLFWVAAVWTALALWADDVRGIYIAMLCVVLGVVQLFRSAE